MKNKDLQRQIDDAEFRLQGVLSVLYPELSDPALRDWIRKRIADDASSIEPNENGVFMSPIDGREYPNRAALEGGLLASFCSYMARELREKHRNENQGKVS